MFKIAVDVDNVVNDLMEKTLEEYNRIHSTTYSIADCTDYNFNNFPDEMAKELVELFYSDGVKNSISVTSDSLWGVETLVNLGYDVYFATATPPEHFGWKISWIRKHFPMIDDNHIICIFNKGLLNVDVLIDDYVENLKAGLYDRICFDKPWNKSTRDSVYNIYRVTSWKGVISSIKTIERKLEEWNNALT